MAEKTCIRPSCGHAESRHSPHCLEGPIGCTCPGFVGAIGDAADRERYVTERAEFLAKAFRTALAALDGPVFVTTNEAVAAFQNLIDRGVLK